MAWVPLHLSGLSYYFAAGSSTLLDSVISLDNGYPDVVNTAGVDCHWFFEFDEGQGNIRARITVTIPPLPEVGGSEYGLFSNDEADIETASGTGPHDFTCYPFGELNTPVLGFFAGSGEKSDDSEYLIEIWDGAEEGAAIPLLTKDRETTLVTPAIPGQAAIEEVTFRMWATPLPLGLTYNQFERGGVLLPNSLATTSGWVQVIEAPTVFYDTISGYTFRSIEELASGSVSIPSSWIPVVETIEGVPTLTGYLVPIMASAPMPPTFHGPILRMEFVTFEGVPVESNGYPIGGGTFNGYFDAPSLDGVVRVNGTYVKDHRGVLLRTGGDPLPDYCTITGSAKVVVMSEFPGRAASSPVPAVYSVNDFPGWNAGAVSIDSSVGDVDVVFTPYMVSAVAVGLCAADRDGTDLESLTHALYFDTAPDGSLRYRVMENGAIVFGAAPHDVEAVYTLRREAGQVSYLVGEDVAYTSWNHSSGAIRAATALYRGKDGVF